MNNKQAIEHLERLRADCNEFVSIETKEDDDDDVMVLSIAIAALSIAIAALRTAQEVPVQEQLIECGSCYKDTGYLTNKLV